MDDTGNAAVSFCGDVLEALIEIKDELKTLNGLYSNLEETVEELQHNQDNIDSKLDSLCSDLSD